MEDHHYRRAVARLSLEYVVCLLTEGVADSGLDMLDFVIVLVVSASNIGHLKGRAPAQDPWAERPVPPEMMIPVSRQNIAESLKLPVQAAGQRIDRLVERGVLVETGAGICIGTPVTNSSAATRLAEKNLAFTGRLMRQLAHVGLEV